MAIFYSYVSHNQRVSWSKPQKKSIKTSSRGSHPAIHPLGHPSSLATARTVPAPQKGSITVCSPMRRRQGLVGGRPIAYYIYIYILYISERYGGFHRPGYPQNGWFISWKTPLKWMIWGCPYFRKPPYDFISDEMKFPTVSGKMKIRVSNHQLGKVIDLQIPRSHG